MKRPLRALIVEDSEDDALLLLKELQRAGFEPIHERVETPEAFTKALETERWDIIIADFVMPRFSGLEALRIVNEMNQDAPFIVLSGLIREDEAVEAMRAGAKDFIVKGKWARLIPAVERELHDADERRKQRRTEAALLESETRYRSIFEHSADGMSISRPDPKSGKWRIIDCNAAFVGMSGRIREELLASTDVRDFQEDGDGPGESGKPTVFDVQMPQKRLFSWKRPDGRENYIESIAVPFFGTDHQLMLVIDRDVTEQARAEANVRHLNTVLRAVRNVNQLIFHEKNRKVLLKTICDNFTENRGYSFAWISLYNASGKIGELLTSDMESEHDGFFVEMIEAMAEACELNMPAEPEVLVIENGRPQCITCPLCRRFPFDRRMLVRLAYEGEVFGALGVSVPGNLVIDAEEQALFGEAAGDIGLALHRMRAEEEHRSMKQEKTKLETQLRQAQKLETIGTLAGGIAHDFNNVLFPIIGYTELALEDLDPASPVRRNLNEVLKASLRAKELIGQILTFSRRTEQARNPLKIGSVVNEAMKLLRASIPSSIRMEKDFQPNPGAIMADATQIHQVIMNLCTNAFQAMGENGGVLAVSLQNVDMDVDYTDTNLSMKPGPYIKLSVSDTGHGMTHDVVERIFEPFFTTKPSGQGTGMGLSVVHGIVKSHGGSISVYSEPGIGTTFNVYLPRIGSLESSREEKPQPVIPGGKERVLLVDDEEMIVAMLKEALERMGYRVDARTDSRHALESFEKDPFAYDMVISDQTMPVLSGMELAEKMQRLRPDIPIILCTGFSERINREMGVGAGFRECIMKPVVKSELALAMRRVLDNR